MFDRAAEVAATARALAEAVTAEFGLVGLNGLDFIAQDGVPFPIEVNPRYSASMELVEASLGIRAVRFARTRLSWRPSAAPPPGRAVTGKAIVFARRAVRVGDTRRWQFRNIADIPHTGEEIGRGHPICTVFAEGRGVDECRAKLVKRADRIYRMVETAWGAA